ncbi:MAG: glycosyltransferase family 4 protein [Saprospiraceae bacterium]|nr:glycosyltransferase family 4 protein [Saprospiraceae bacterium]
MRKQKSKTDFKSGAHQPRRIALVSNSSWYTYNFRLGLLRRLREMGVEVYVISPHDHYSTKLIAEGFHFCQLPIAVYGTNPLREWRGIQQLIRIYRTHRFDFIFHYTAKPNIYGAIAAWWCGIPSIAITTGLGLMRDEAKGFSRLMVLGLYRIAARLSKEVWFLNNDDLRFFQERGVVGPKKSFVLPSEGVDITWYRAGEDRGAHKPVRFLYAGRIVWSKGMKELYEAARYFHDQGEDCVFHLVGFIVPDHPDAVSFELLQQWQQQGIVRFHGETEDIRPFLAEADCVVLPSFFGEGVPRILLEAAAMGKPVITTDSVGCREVVKEGANGLLCKPRDAADLIRKIDTFLALSPGERRQMGLEGRKKVIREFDEEIIIGHYLNALHRFLGWPARRKKNWVMR